MLPNEYLSKVQLPENRVEFFLNELEKDLIGDLQVFSQIDNKGAIDGLLGKPSQNTNKEYQKGYEQGLLLRNSITPEEKEYLEFVYSNFVTFLAGHV